MHYQLSFTALSLATAEMKEIARLYLQTKDWEKVQKSVVEENILQKTKISTRKRIFQEIKKRIEHLTETELEILAFHSYDEARLIALLSLYKTYRFLFDFAVEVLRKKLLLFDTNLLQSDYETFIESKKLGYENLQTLAPTTATKIRQITFRIFKEAGLLQDGKIQKPLLSPSITQAILGDNPIYLQGFLLSDQEIQAMIKARR